MSMRRRIHVYEEENTWQESDLGSERKTSSERASAKGIWNQSCCIFSIFGNPVHMLNSINWLTDRRVPGWSTALIIFERCQKRIAAFAPQPAKQEGRREHLGEMRLSARDGRVCSGS